MQPRTDRHADTGGAGIRPAGREVIHMATAIAIIAVAACCIACGYGISRVIRRSKERRARVEALRTR